MHLTKPITQNVMLKYTELLLLQVRPQARKFILPGC